MGKRVERTRNANTLTEAAYWSMVRSILRRGFRFWKPAINAKMKARRKYEGENKRQKWEYQCNHCEEWFADKEVQTDHVVACGQLKYLEDVSGFLERLTAEGKESFQILCLKCHQKKTNLEREEIKRGKGDA
jgi:5-methylcytosine-specific restriction endonuclease McrA